MLPTSSSTFFVGRNARSATALINWFGPPRVHRLGVRERGRQSLRQVHLKEQLTTVAHCGEPALQPALSWYVARALRVWRMRSCTVIASGLAALVVAACGSGSRQDAHEPRGKFKVAV